MTSSKVSEIFIYENNVLVERIEKSSQSLAVKYVNDFKEGLTSEELKRYNFKIKKV